MKLRIKIRIIGVFVLLLSLSLVFSQLGLANEQGEDTSYVSIAQKILEEMKEGMTNAPKTGDVSLDFLAEMIPHHEAAIALSGAILKYGSQAKVQKLAQDIVKEQESGIAKMKRLQERMQRKPEIDKEKEASYLQAYVQIYRQMIAEMEAAPASGNPDKDFLEQMIPHHEGAIRMATNILKYTDDDELKKLAQHIVASQKKQLPYMKKLLKSM